MNERITRRRLLGGALAAIPVVGFLARNRLVKVAEFHIEFTGSPFRIDITAWGDGSLTAAFNGEPMRVVSTRNDWLTFDGRIGDVLAATRVKFDDDCLLVDYVRIEGTSAAVGALGAAHGVV